MAIGLGDNADTTVGFDRRVTLVASVAASFTYASFQNASPVLRSISIDNPTLQSFSGCVL